MKAPKESNIPEAAEWRGEELRAGEILTTTADAETGVEFLLLRSIGARVQLAVADTNPLLGASDVALDPDHPLGPLSVRLDETVWLDRESLPGRWIRNGRLEVEDMTAVLERLSALESGKVEPIPEDFEEAYQRWRRTVVSSAREALRMAAKRLEAPPRPGLRWQQAALIAAGLAAVFLSIPLANRWTESPAAPVVNRPQLVVEAGAPPRGAAVVEAADRGFRLIVVVPGAQPGARLAIEVRSAVDKQLVWKAERPAEVRGEEISVDFPGGLAAGEYALILLPVEPGLPRFEPISFRVRSPG